MKLNPDDIDTVYPSGSAWVDDDYGDGSDFRHYVPALSMPKEQWCFKVICNESYGGCGAEIRGDSREEAIEKWNARYEQTM
jgi:hypothetical protein